MTMINENPNMNVIIVINNQINKTIFGSSTKNIQKRIYNIYEMDLMSVCVRRRKCFL